MAGDLAECVNEEIEDLCERIAKTPEADAFARALLGELTGVNDVERCAGGKASGCAWAGASVFPLLRLGKLLKFLRLSKRGSNAADLVVGPYGAVPRAILERAVAAGGPTTKVVTNLTNPPAAGRGLSVAYGDAADALAGQARTEGALYTAQIPNALLQELERAGLLKYSTTQMGGVTGPEIRFLPGATEFIVPFFGAS